MSGYFEDKKTASVLIKRKSVEETCTTHNLYAGATVITHKTVLTALRSKVDAPVGIAQKLVDKSAKNRNIYNLRKINLHALLPVYNQIKKENRFLSGDGRHPVEKTTLLNAKLSLIFGGVPFIFALPILFYAVMIVSVGFRAIFTEDFIYILFSWSGIIAITLGFVALYRILSHKEKYKGIGTSITGIVLGIISLIIAVASFCYGV